MPSLRSLLASACIAATAQGFSVTLRSETSIEQYNNQDATGAYYRIYESTIEAPSGVCQDVLGQVNPDWTCAQYEDQGATGPLECEEESGIPSYPAFVTDSEAPNMVCVFYNEPGCFGEDNAAAIVPLEPYFAPDASSWFKSFSCVLKVG